MDGSPRAANLLRDDLVPGREREGDLGERDYQLGLLRWREEHVIAGAARRLKRGVDAGGDLFEVFNDCQDHVLAAARAHTEREIAEAFARGVEATADPELRAVLGRVCDLHCLARIEADRGWFQEHGRISSPRAKATTRAVNTLCGELRAHAVALVDAFGIPDQVLAAPIALPGGPASQTSYTDFGDELPSARKLVEQLG